MTRISHHIQINSNAEAFIEFYKNYNNYFTELAPQNHLRFRFLSQPPIQVGTITESEEIMLGKHQKVRHKIVVFSPEEIALKGLFPLSLIGGKLLFKIEAFDGYIVLHEILEFGFKSPFGRLFDTVIRIYLKDKDFILNSHSKETLLNIKKILEANISTSPISQEC